VSGGYQSDILSRYQLFNDMTAAIVKFAREDSVSGVVIGESIGSEEDVYCG